jgi:hypothetical protein
MVRRIARLLGILCVVAGPATASAQQLWSGILAPARAINWSAAGVTGGIPNRTTVCQTLNPGATASQVQAALNACAAGQVVNLNPGTYTMSTGLSIPSNVTLRGAGANQTILNFTGTGAYFWGRYLVGFTGSGGNQEGAKPGPEGSSAGTRRAWIGTNGQLGVYAQGSTVLNLESAPSGLSVGANLFLYQDDDASASVPSTSLFVSAKTGSGTSGVAREGPGYNSAGAAQTQEVKVVAINGSAVTVTPGIFMPNWRGSQNPQAYWWSGGDVRNAGLEDLAVVDAGARSSWTAIVFFEASDSWMSGVRLQAFSSSCGSGASTRSGVLIQVSRNITVHGNYLGTMFGGGSGSTTSYTIEGLHASSSLIQNNIIYGAESPVFLNLGSVGNVVAYNYDVGGPVCSGSTGLSNHDAGTAYQLFEGNISPQHRADTYHGSSAFFTHFRNRYSGVDGVPPIDLWSYNRNYNFVGNVLGTTGKQGRYQCDGDSASTCNRYSGGGAVFRLGYPADSTALADAGVGYDSQVAATSLRWGNWDNVNNSGRFISSDVPTGVQYPNAVPTSQTLPASFYLGGPPAWWSSSFGAVPWPAIGPDVAGGNISGASGHAYKIPAQLCFESVTISGFSSAACYGGGATQAAPNAPGTPTLN